MSLNPVNHAVRMRLAYTHHAIDAVAKVFEYECPSCSHVERKRVGYREMIAGPEEACAALQKAEGVPYDDCKCGPCVSRRRRDATRALFSRGNQTRAKKMAKSRAAKEAAMSRSMAL